MATALSEIQTINLYRAHGTVYDGNYLHVVSYDKLYAYSINDDGTLYQVAVTPLHVGRIQYVIFDGTRLHITDYSSRIWAVVFDGTTHRRSTFHEPLTNNATANSNGEIFGYEGSSSNVVKKMVYEPSTGYTVVASNITPTDGGVYGMACDSNFFLVCRHMSSGATVSLFRASDLALIDTANANRPDGALVKSGKAAIADKSTFRVYNVSGWHLDEIDRIFLPNNIFDNIDYDGNNNFHIYDNDSISHVYLDRSTLIFGETLNLNRDGRIMWNCSTNVGSYFYVTSEYRLHAIRKASGDPENKRRPKIMMIF